MRVIKPGDKFARLTVVEIDSLKENKKNSYYICLCACGKTKSVMRGNLLSRATISCGCFRKQRAAHLSKQRILIETGNRYGKLAVICRKDTSKGKVGWLCLCDCGKETLVEGYCLRSGNSTSCGCKRKETLRSLPSKAINEIGNRYGLLTVIRRGENVRNLAQWWCHCECGNKVLKNGNHLRSGKTESCGCLELSNRSDNCKKRRIKHRLSNHPLYRKFHSIKARCYRKSAPDYPRYGGRGISICNEWLENVSSFIEWAIKNGWRENAKLSIDRKNNDGNYCPENCRIISFADNTVKRYTDRGQGLSICGFAINIREMIRQSQVSPNTIKKLVSAGYLTDSIVEYGKLEHHQKMAIGLSIKNGTPLSVEDARNIEKKYKVYPKPSGYTNYMGMIGRCYNPRNNAYHRYGGRGIKVCSEWHNFNQFISDMGPPPYPDAALHRIDENKGYSASNCIWASRSENAKAMHRSKKLISTH